MTVLGRDVLTAAGKKNAPLRKWLTLWTATIEASNWQGIDEVRKTYPSADGVVLASKTVVTVFNVKGNDYRLLAWIDYGAQVVEVLEVISHAEYTKDLWKGRY